MKAFRVFHWNTFDNKSLEIAQTNLLKDAVEFVHERYGDRIRPDKSGADRVEIVDINGNVVKKFSVA